MPSRGASESFLQAAATAQDAVKSSDLRRQEIQIKVEPSRKERLLTPIVEADQHRESSPMLNSSSRSTQVKVEPLTCFIELLDDDEDDILEIITECSLLNEVVNISDDEDAGVSVPRPIKTASAKRKGKVLRLFGKYA